MRRTRYGRPLAALLVSAFAVLGTATAAAAHVHHGKRGRSQTSASQFTAHVFVQGATISHPLGTGTEPISNPDDITQLAGHIFVAFQNGVGPQGQASPSGNLDSTIVEFTRGGRELAQWDVTGKCDGVTADPVTGKVIATVNEDANSSVYLISPDGGAPVHYTYSEPLPSDGGTDAISIFNGVPLISASAPGTTGVAAPQASYPAIYVVQFDSSNQIAYIRGLFGDEASAIVANTNLDTFGSTVTLGLTDPDSNEVVPWWAHRFAGKFMLTSQGDQEQIYFGGDKPLQVLSLTNSVDDSAWPTGPGGELYTTDNSSGDVIAVTGPFERGSEIAAVTPCDSNNAPATCPGPGFPPNYLGRINPDTGVITRIAVSGPEFQPQGMLFLPDARS
jgi:hypothetical protein